MFHVKHFFDFFTKTLRCFDIVIITNRMQQIKKPENRKILKAFILIKNTFKSFFTIK